MAKAKTEGTNNDAYLMEEAQLFKDEYDKFAGGNKSAGTRARKHLMNIMKTAKQLRKDITETKNADK